MSSSDTACQSRLLRRAAACCSSALVNRYSPVAATLSAQSQPLLQ